MSEIENGCPFCGGTVGHADDCPRKKIGATYGTCAVCGRSLDADDHVYVFDGNDKVVCEHCMVFTKDSLIEFLDMLGIEYYAGEAREMIE